MGAHRGTSRRPWIGLCALLALAAAGLWALRGGDEGRALAPVAPEPGAPSAPAPDDGPRPVERVAATGSEHGAASGVKIRRIGDVGDGEGDGRVVPRSAGPLHGVTVDEAGRPLAGARVVFPAPPWAGGELERTLRRSVVSAGDGTFVVEDFAPEHALQPPSVKLAGYVLLSASPYRRTDDGRWAPLELVLGSSATLEVTLLDARDAPLAGSWVAALPARAELFALGQRHQAWTNAAKKRRRVTDANGRATFELPAGRHLAVVSESSDPEHPAERCVGDRLTSEDEGLPLVLAPGEHRRVVLLVGATLKLEGRVVGPERLPVPGARVRVLDGEPEESGWFESRMDSTADDEGRFGLLLRGMAREDVLTILAGDGQWIAIQGAGVRNATRRRIEVGAWLDAPEPLELVLEPLLTIQGRIEDEKGAPVSAVVWAVPPGAPYLLQKGSLGFLPLSALRRADGAFEVPALRPGRHDVIVKRNQPRTYHRFPGIAAGARDQVLVIEEDRVVRLRLLVEGAAPGARLQPIVLWHQPRDPARFGRPHASPSFVVEGCDEAHWPARQIPDRGYVGNVSQNVEYAEGRTIVLFEPTDAATDRALEPRQLGCYSVGLRAWDAAGRLYARRLSPPLWLAAGEVTFVVRLELGATLEGSVPAGAEAGLCVELRDAGGATVRDARGELWTTVTAEGTFRLEEVPPGPLELRVGTQRELEAGRWRWRERVQVAPGAQVSVHLQ